MAKKKKTTPALSQLLSQVNDESTLVATVERKKLSDQRKKQEKNPYIPLGFHPSSLEVDSCSRALVLERLGVPNKDLHMPQLLRIFRVGTDAHRSWQRDIFESGLVKAHQIEVPIHKVRKTLPLDDCQMLGLDKRPRVPKAWQQKMEKVVKMTAPFELRGHSDAVLDDNTVLEIKTINARMYSLFPEQGKVYPKQLLQASLYAWALQSDQILFLFENKDNQQVVEVPLKPNYEGVNAVLVVVKDAKKALEAGELPDRHEKCPRRNSAKANKCTFADACFGKRTFEELDARKGKKPRDYR